MSRARARDECVNYYLCADLLKDIEVNSADYKAKVCHYRERGEGGGGGGGYSVCVCERDRERVCVCVIKGEGFEQDGENRKIEKDSRDISKG